MPLTESQKQAIELLPTADLVEAVIKRYDDAIFAGIQERGHTTESVEGREEVDGYRVVTRRFGGDTIACIGMARMLSKMCEEALEESISPMSTDDL